MPYIRYVHHVEHLVAMKLQCTAQDILEYVSAQIAYMGIIVNSGSATVHSNLITLQRGEFA